MHAFARTLAFAAAALAVLMGEGGLGPLLEEAVRAAAARSRELGK